MGLLFFVVDVVLDVNYAFVFGVDVDLVFVCVFDLDVDVDVFFDVHFDVAVVLHFLVYRFRCLRSFCHGVIMISW